MKDINRMTREELRIYLIRALSEEMPRYGELSVPADEEGQRQLVRSLMNVRPPIPAAPEFVEAQDAYLSGEIKSRGVVDSRTLPPVSRNERLFLWRGDITRLKIDAIVNAANSALLGCFIPLHTCIDNIIHSYSGVQLRLACNKIIEEQGYEEPAGRAKITPGFNLPCKYVLHTVGPIVSGPLQERDCALLASCYRSCLELAEKSGLSSIAFCCISTGVFRFPQDMAAKIAVQTVLDFLERNQTIRQVVFNVFTDRDLAIYRRILGSQKDIFKNKTV